jgi:hypothetical protein
MLTAKPFLHNGHSCVTDDGGFEKKGAGGRRAPEIGGFTRFSKALLFLA